MNLLSYLRRPPADCREVGRRLQSYLDGELDDRHLSNIGAHLDACRDCGLEATTYRAVKESLAREAPPVDEATLDRLRQFGTALMTSDR